MYHDEKVINGILHWRGTPTGKWKPYTLEQLTKKLKKAKDWIAQLNEEINELEKSAPKLRSLDCNT